MIYFHFAEKQVIYGDHCTCETSHSVTLLSMHYAIGTIFPLFNWLKPEMSTSEGKIQMGRLLKLRSGQIPL